MSANANDMSGNIPLTPIPRPGIEGLAPYVPGREGAEGAGNHPVYKLSANESALGASAMAIEAYNNAGSALHRYPDGGATDLRNKIAEVHDLNADQLICGAGSDEILHIICQAYVGAGENIIQNEHGFLVYAIAARSFGAQVQFAKEHDLTANVDEILQLVDDKTRIVFVANPNNPTGTYLPITEIRRLHEGLRRDILLVIDCAYAEYIDEADYDAGIDLVERNRNVIVTRTFSKIYGLGALRLGWGYGPPGVIDALNRIRGPFNVSSPAQAAGVAALDDQNFVMRNREHNRIERDIMYQRLNGLGLTCRRSFGNFLLVRLPQEPGKSADDVQRFLEDNGVIVREMTAYGLPEYLRISVGEKAANARVLDLLSHKFGGA